MLGLVRTTLAPLTLSPSILPVTKHFPLPSESTSGSPVKPPPLGVARVHKPEVAPAELVVHPRLFSKVSLHNTRLVVDAFAASHCCGHAVGHVQRPPVAPIRAEKPNRTRAPQVNAGVVNLYVVPETRTPLILDVVAAPSYFQIIRAVAGAVAPTGEVKVATISSPPAALKFSGNPFGN